MSARQLNSSQMETEVRCLIIDCKSHELRDELFPALRPHIRTWSAGLRVQWGCLIMDSQSHPHTHTLSASSLQFPLY